MTKYLIVISLFFASSFQVSAQKLVGKFPVSSKTFQIYSGMPPQCDAPTKAAATTWNGANVRFTLSSAGMSMYNPSLNDATNSQINIGARPMPNPSYAALADYSVTAYSNNLYTFSDVDIIVNENYLFYDNRFYCGISMPPSHQLDYQTMMLHEMGHVYGIDDYGVPYDSRMVMWGAGPGWGNIRRVLTQIDIDNATTLYGRR